MNATQELPQQLEPKPTPRKWPRRAAIGVGLVVVLGVGVAIGAAGQRAQVKVPGDAREVTRDPGPPGRRGQRALRRENSRPQHRPPPPRHGHLLNPKPPGFSSGTYQPAEPPCRVQPRGAPGRAVPVRRKRQASRPGTVFLYSRT